MYTRGSNINKSYTTIEPALLTRTEIDWLLGKIKVSKSYEYKLKSSIKRKIKDFTNLELPLLKKTGLIPHDLDLTVFGKNLTVYSKGNKLTEDTSNRKNEEENRAYVKEKSREWARRDSNPRPSLCESDVQDQARRLARLDRSDNIFYLCVRK